MPSIARRWLFCVAGAVFVLYSLQSFHGSLPQSQTFSPPTHISSSVSEWRKVSNTRHPITSFASLPTGRPVKLPRIQAAFDSPESNDVKAKRLERLDSVKEAMRHSWHGYRTHAWLKDEVAPISGSFADRFGGWAATLVDSLDTLWIMDMKDEFYEAVGAISEIDFSTSRQGAVNVFETTIRYMGGFLSAYDLSGEQVLLDKAAELGELLYIAFDTPNHLPVPRWDWRAGLSGHEQKSSPNAVAAEIGSLSLEFTRLSQLTGDMRFYDAIDRITRELAAQQDQTHLPGLWPFILDAASGVFTGNSDFSIGAMADSMYEYLPKMHMLLGGLEPIYRPMYEKSYAAMERHLFFRALNPQNLDILFPGNMHASRPFPTSDVTATATLNLLTPIVQHLGCYAGGMVGIGARLFERTTDEAVARKLTDGCVWAYNATRSGIMPEVFFALPCNETENPSCTWSEDHWLHAIDGGPDASSVETSAGLAGARAFANRTHLPQGFTKTHDRRYLLRPEAIESVFVLYRMTGDTTLQDAGWRMFEGVANATRTDVAHAALKDVMVDSPSTVDSMESFWTAETLKYYYLLFSEPTVVSLDEFVLNTEAHPFRRPVPAKKGWWW